MKVVPGSSRTAVGGLLENTVKIKVAAPPEKGKANQALVSFLAELLGVKKNAVRIMSGQTSPAKRVEVLGVSAQQAASALGLDEPPCP